MTPEIRRLLTASPYLDRLLTFERNAWAALTDMVEETGNADRTWVSVYEHLRELEQRAEPPSERTVVSREGENAMRLLFRGIATASYPYAVHLNLLWSNERRTGEPYRSRNSGLQDAAVDGMNTARCGENWEENLEQEQIEEVLGEEQGSLERKALTYREGMLEGDLVAAVSDERHHRWWLAYAPEWLEWELKQEHDEDGEFLTLITSGGGYMSAEPDYLIIDSGKEEDEVWQKVAEPAHGAERECPYQTWDPEIREEVRDARVKLEHTFCGERPGVECRYCGADIGEPHGYIYIGEGAETVYLRLRDEETDED